MKKKISALLVIIMLLMLACGIVPASAANSLNSISPKPEKPYVSGTFIQPFLYDNYTPSQWDKECQWWKSYGIEYVIMGDTAHKGNDGKWDVCYPTTIPEIKNNLSSNDERSVGNLLEACKRNGIKVFLGIGNDEQWFKQNLATSGGRKWYLEFCEEAAKIAEDVYTQFKGEYPDTFVGFYSVPEIYNHYAFNEEMSRKVYVNNIVDGYNIFLDKLTQLDPSMPLLFSPFQNPNVQGTLDNTMQFWEDFIATANFRDNDILCPQDSVGAGGMSLENLGPWYAGYRKAIDNANKRSGRNMLLWSNNENFIQPEDTSDPWPTCTVKRFATQIETVWPYVDRVFSFAWPHYFSPLNADEGFDRSLRYYFDNGTVETTPPSDITKVSTKMAKNGKDLIITWTPSTDDYDINFYNVYKYVKGSADKFVLTNRTSVGRKDGKQIRITPPTPSVTIKDYKASDDTIYMIKAVDCTGNESNPVYVKINPGNEVNNVDLKSADGETGLLSDQELFELTGIEPATTPKSKSNNTTLYLAIGIAVLLIAVVVLVVVLDMKKTKKKRLEKAESNENESK